LRRKITGQEKGEIVEGELVQRAYTPVSMQNDTGFIDMLIKCVALFLLLYRILTV
jgi:nitrate reductase (NAD(P)H)